MFNYSILDDLWAVETLIIIIFNLGTSDDFTAYAPIIEQVKITAQELKEIVKLHQRSIDQELKLLDQFSRSTSHQPKTND